jgi:glycosyltransferase involved in cell wall biosynthesis
VRQSPPAVPSAWPIAGGHVTVALVIGTLDHPGAARHVVALVRALGPGRHRLRVYALAGSPEPIAGRLRALGVPLTLVPRRHAYEPARIVALARAFKRDGVDLVHALLPAGAAYGALAARLAGVPILVVTSRAGDSREQRRVRRLLHRIYRGASALVANSRAEARRVAEEADVPLERIQVVYDGVDLGRHHAPGMLDGLRERVWHRPLVIGGAGSRTTGRARFVAAAARIAARHPDAHFVWLEEETGDDSGGAAFELPHGLTVSIVPVDDDPGPVLEELTLLCVAGTPDRPGLDLVPAAMAAGRPIVATAAPGIDELVADGATGIVTPADDAGAFASAAVALLEDPARRKSAGHTARLHAERRLGGDRMARATAAIYEAALLGRLTPVAAFGAAVASTAGEDG